MRSQRRITTGGAADGLRGAALDVSQLVGIDDRHKCNETLFNTFATINSM